MVSRWWHGRNNRSLWKWKRLACRGQVLHNYWYFMILFSSFFKLIICYLGWFRTEVRVFQCDTERFKSDVNTHSFKWSTPLRQKFDLILSMLFLLILLYLRVLTSWYRFANSKVRLYWESLCWGTSQSLMYLLLEVIGAMQPVNLSWIVMVTYYS